MIYVEESAAASKVSPELSCPHCKTSGEIEISIIRTKVSAGFLPMLAWVKRGEAMCLHCGLPVTIKEAGEPFKKAYLSLKAENRTPAYLWSGMIICILGLMGVFAHFAYQQSNNPFMQKIEQSMLEAPKAGDLYEVSIDKTMDKKTGVEDYALAKVEKAEGDTVTLRYSTNVLRQQFPPMFKELAGNPGRFDDNIILVKKSKLMNKDLFSSRSPYEYMGKIFAAKRP